MNHTDKPSVSLQHISKGTYSLLLKGGISNIEELVEVSDLRLTGILRAGSATRTRQRIAEVRYALIKAGLSKTHKLGPS